MTNYLFQMKVLLLLCLAGLAIAFPVPGNTGNGKPVPRVGSDWGLKVAEDRKYAPAPPKYSPNKGVLLKIDFIKERPIPGGHHTTPLQAHQ